MVVGIALNEVLRDFIGQIEYTYNKYVEGDDIDIESNPVTSFNLIEHFPFKTTEELNKFLYRDAALEIFGHADELEHNLINQLNLFIMDMKDLEGNEIIIITREVMTAIPATLFFLSKTACKCETIKFVQTYADEWNDVDILITANPDALNSKPENKVSVKVKTTYNENVSSDFEIKSLFEFMLDNQLRNKIITSKINK
jgi:hypothetical protein